jgi:peptide/nickel transport system permease protein
MLKYLFGRFMQVLLVIFIGITLTFFIARLGPVDPVESALGELTMMGQFYDPEALEKTREALTKLYGLEGTLFQQYISYWKGMLMGDFGPSLSAFPTPVMSLIKRALPWTMGLMMSSAFLAWIIGNIIGGLSAYFRESFWSPFLGVIAMALRPIPYYIMAFVLMMLFTYIWPIFPDSYAYTPGLDISFSWNFISNVLYHSFLPALSLVAINIGVWFLTMRNLVTNIIEEDYVTYAEVAGLPDRKVISQYVMRNALLPQVTGLALQISFIFNGALIAEYVFTYPGVGTLLYDAIFVGDYALIMGIASFSIIAVAMTTLILDLIYPLLDPRIRYK